MAFILRGKLLFLVTIVALLLSPHCAEAAKKKKLKTEVLEAAPVCKYKAQDGDKVVLHYTAKSKDGQTQFDDTFKVGRPSEMMMGPNMLPGLKEGLQSACPGEKRRVSVPPHKGGSGYTPAVPDGKHVVFEVLLVSLNGKFLHEVEAELQAQSGGSGALEEEQEDLASALDSPLALDSPFCDACNTFVEEFHFAWAKACVEQRSRNQVEQREGGSAVPAITYNDDIEATVQTFCVNDTNSNIRKPYFGPHIQDNCHRILTANKREIVQKFLSAEVSHKMLPERKAEVCAELSHACPGGAGAGTGAVKGECAYCRAAMADLAFELRRRAAPPKGKEASHVYTLLEQNVCQSMLMRHKGPESMVETCDDIADEYSKMIVDAVVKGRLWGTDGAALANFAGLTEKVCVKELGACTSLKDEL